MSNLPLHAVFALAVVVTGPLQFMGVMYFAMWLFWVKDHPAKK